MMKIKKENMPVIIGATRTPIGGFLGCLQSMSAPKLGACVIGGLYSNLKDMPITQMTMGCVLSAGVGQAPARQAALYAGLREDIPSLTVNKVCGSGLMAIMLSCDTILRGETGTFIAGGMESMSNAPYLLPKGRTGKRMGHTSLKDSIFTDGLEDASTGSVMGVFAQNMAQEEGLTRTQQDNYALISNQRALEACEKKYFSNEITPIQIDNRFGPSHEISRDELPRKISLEMLSALKPVFSKTGTITAGTASPLADGAAGVALTSWGEAQRYGKAPLARVCGYTSVARAPKDFCKAPVDAIAKLLSQLSWSTKDVDLYEINEAFSAVTLVAMKAHNLPLEKVNFYGGACALGHPLGASGARVLVTLLNALKNTGGKRGLATLCIGGGEAVALAIEII